MFNWSNFFGGVGDVGRSIEKRHVRRTFGLGSLLGIGLQEYRGWHTKQGLYVYKKGKRVISVFFSVLRYVNFKYIVCWCKMSSCN